MTNRIISGVGIASLATLIALMFWLSRKQVGSDLEIATTNNAYLQVSNALSLQPGTTTNSTNISPTSHKLSPATVTEREQVLSALNDVPIVFYGKLEDQFGNPVEGAEIVGNTVIDSGTRMGSARVSTVSDKSGYFAINAGNGESLGIVPHKEGYLLATMDTSFRYSYMYPDHFIPDQMHPTTIKMWKLQGSASLLSIQSGYRLAITNSPIYFDLLKGNTVPSGGDLEVIVTRGVGPVSQRIHGDWSITLMPVGGGIQAVDYQTAQVTFEAPTDGYQDKYVFQMDRDNPSWTDELRQEFFLKSRNGQVYSKIYLVFVINRDPNRPFALEFKGAANPNGSRSWEPATAAEP